MAHIANMTMRTTNPGLLVGNTFDSELAVFVVFGLEIMGVLVILLMIELII